MTHIHGLPYPITSFWIWPLKVPNENQKGLDLACKVTLSWLYSLVEGCVLVNQLYLTFCNPMDCSPPISSGPWNSPGKKTGVKNLYLLQRIFLTQGLNSSFPHGRQILNHQNHQGRPDWRLLILQAAPCLQVPISSIWLHHFIPKKWIADYYNKFQVVVLILNLCN